MLDLSQLEEYRWQIAHDRDITNLLFGNKRGFDNAGYTFTKRIFLKTHQYQYMHESCIEALHISSLKSNKDIAHKLNQNAG